MRKYQAYVTKANNSGTLKLDQLFAPSTKIDSYEEVLNIILNCKFKVPVIMFTRSRAVDSVADVRVKLFSKMHFDPVDTTTEV